MLSPEISRYLANLMQIAIYNKNDELIEKIRKIKTDKDFYKFVNNE